MAAFIAAQAPDLAATPAELELVEPIRRRLTASGRLRLTRKFLQEAREQVPIRSHSAERRALCTSHVGSPLDRHCRWRESDKPGSREAVIIFSVGIIHATHASLQLGLLQA